MAWRRSAAFSNPSPAKASVGDADTADQITRQSLDAQAALLPYALALFGVALPIFAWACTFAPDRVWMTASFLIFAINWAAFYGVVDAFRRDPSLAENLPARARAHVLGALLWAGAVAQITAIAVEAGPAREGMELLTVGGAAACLFFCCPYLPSLLIAGPAACAAPLLALFCVPQTRAQGEVALGALALVMALSLIFNRLLRRQFDLAAEHERLVEERARSLSRAEDLARSKSDLIATLSHEIRNGLTGVAHVLAAAATAGGRGGPSRDQMAAALGSARDLIEALNATLDTESAEAGRLVLEPCGFDAAQMLREVAAGYRTLAATKGLELSVHVDEGLDAGPGAAIGDPARCRQILGNLIVNAIKYTVRGRVEVRAERLGDRRLRFEIAEAFLPFKRIARTDAGVSGAGLGLSLSRRLAELMGGEVSADSAPGVGSCFRFDLPFDATSPPARAAVSPAASPTGEASTEVRALRILTADDNGLSVAMLRAVLEQLGHQVLHAHDGRRALELARICEVDLVFLAARMPGLDGPDIVRGLRAQSGPIARVPVITLIEGDPEEARACLEAGADQILRRPVTVSSVARAIAAAQSQEPAPPLRGTGAR